MSGNSVTTRPAAVEPTEVLNPGEFIKQVYRLGYGAQEVTLRNDATALDLLEALGLSAKVDNTTVMVGSRVLALNERVPRNNHRVIIGGNVAGGTR